MRTIVLVTLIVAVGVAPAACLAQEEGEGEVGVAQLDPQAERAIQRGIQYLVQTQNPDGSWDKTYPVAVTSVSLMAFMLKGHFPKKGQYGEKLDNALGFLIARSKVAGGYMGANMYEHGLATLALSEAWGMSQRDEVRNSLKRAVEIILTSQNHAGGWRYQPQPHDADVSVTVMQIVALQSAREAGISVPAETLKKAIAYVKSLQVKTEGGFGYTGPSQPEFARSAAGVMSLLIAGERKTPEVRMGLDYLRRLPESKFDKEKFYTYGHYYAIQAMYQAGEAYYQDWYPKIKAGLLRHQKGDGSFSGEGGPGFCTAVSILILGVPYRYLPIYQR